MPDVFTTMDELLAILAGIFVGHAALSPREDAGALDQRLDVSLEISNGLGDAVEVLLY